MQIYVIAHKLFDMPTSDPLYVPLSVGNGIPEMELPTGWESDRTGDSISDRNPRYNELTGLYWIWKNSPSEIAGLCHYRRFFATLSGKIKNLASGDVTGLIGEREIKKWLSRYDIILHNKTWFRETNERQLMKTGDPELDKSKLDAEILALAERVFGELYPEDASLYRQVMERKYAHLLNILITRKPVIDEYCAWLFPLLFQIEKEAGMEYPGQTLPRMMGLLAERYLDIWVLKKRLKVKECFTVNTERIDRKFWG
ncbi:MAG: DUF4422 domain-containing protein [Lachnospiraceae bacterium]|nr:DUF4422 domain-containing protein [Lachnospiraceae bacterium]